MERPLVKLPLQGERGELWIIGRRVCLTDIETAWFFLRKSFQQLVGGVAHTAFYDAGLRAGRFWGTEVLRLGLAPPGEEGLRGLVQQLSLWGYGNLQLKEIDLKEGKAVMECAGPPSMEAFGYVANNELSKEPVCDYSRGILAGLMSAFSDRGDIAAYEKSCLAMGYEKCVFVVDEEEVVRKALLKKRPPHN